MAGKTIQAAGGIVMRRGPRPLVAVVQRNKDKLWVLPRGKLKRNESPIIGARREVVEETGHRVRVREFLGATTYRVGTRLKVVWFWRMQAAPEPRGHEQHFSGRMAAARRSDPTAKPSAGKIVSERYRPQRNSPPQAPQGDRAWCKVAAFDRQCRQTLIVVFRKRDIPLNE